MLSNQSNQSTLKQILRILRVGVGVGVGVFGWMGIGYTQEGAIVNIPGAITAPASSSNTPSLVDIKPTTPLNLNQSIDTQNPNSPNRQKSPTSVTEADNKTQTDDPYLHNNRKGNKTKSLFQQYVQDSTGVNLPIYGADLFQSSRGIVPDDGQPAPLDYLLAPGDTIKISIWGSLDYFDTHKIDKSGQIFLPKIGSVFLAGTSVRNLNRQLRGAIAKTYNNFDVNVKLDRLRKIQVYFVGHVDDPGTQLIPGVSTFLSAVFMIGGPSATGSMRNIQLKREGRVIATLDLYEFIAKGDKRGDIPLESGDTIVFTPAKGRIAVLGSHEPNAIYEIIPNVSNLGEVLTLTGGISNLSTIKKALVERVDAKLNPSRFVLTTSLDRMGLSTPLKDADIVTILGISPEFANAVTLQGAVAAPMRYPWVKDMKISDLIPEKEALITQDYYKRKNSLVQFMASDRSPVALDQKTRLMPDRINWNYALVERLDKTTLETKIMPFDLEKAIITRDPKNDLMLEPGDVVTILSYDDIKLPQSQRMRMVKVEGEVKTPGLYQVQPGETLPQLIQRIGGLSPQAYVFGLEMTRKSVRELQQHNLDNLIKGLEQQLQSQVITQATSTTTNLEQQLQMQRQQTQMQLSRLRAFRSTGRVSLELEPKMQLSISDLPPLPLEDGDKIVIPSIPSFISAMGAVNNENVFIYKAGRTVKDVLMVAGLTEDAETDSMFVVRADGSIVASRHSGGWFFSSRNIDSTQLMPGDTIVIPTKMDRETLYSAVTRVVKDWTQILANFGLGAMAIKALKN